MPRNTPAPVLRPARQGGAAGLILISFIALRYLFVHAPAPVLHPDSYVYLSESAQPVGDLVWGFFGAATWRPVGYSLFLHLCGAASEDAATLVPVVHGQMLLSGLAFGLAALTAARHLCRTRWGRIAVIIVFALTSLTWFSGPWDAALLSESVSLSCFLMICVLLAIAFARKTPPPPQKSDVDAPEFIDEQPAGGRPVRFAVTLCVLLPLCAIFLQLRDAHIPLVLGLLGVMLIHVLRRWRAWSGPSRLAAALWIAALAGLALLQSRAAVASGRADWPLTNVLSIRVLPDPERFDAFVNDFGLPRELAPLVGRFVWDGWRDQPVYAAWLVDRGRTSYSQFLFSNPGYAARQILGAFRVAAEDVTSQNLAGYFATADGSSPLRLRLCAAVTDLMTLPQRLIVAAGGSQVFWPLLTALACMAAVILWREKQTGALYASAFAVVVLVLQVAATTLLDACEDSRHNLLAYALLVLVFWLPLIVICDDVSARRDAANESASP